MANLTFREKAYLEQLLVMEDGYVLDFTNRSFRSFIVEALDIDIELEKYYIIGNSKANRMRAFWELESSYTVAKLIEKLQEYWFDQINLKNRVHNNTDEKIYEECSKIATRLRTESPVENIDSITPNSEDKSFHKLAETIRKYIENNEPDLGLDRLHTFLIKYFRELCDKYKITYRKNTPLHSLFGGYIKKLKTENQLDSEMSERILKSSISVMEAFNSVRNSQSFAHDNQLLNYNESLLIFNNVANVIRFVETIEGSNNLESNNKESKNVIWDDGLPF